MFFAVLESMAPDDQSFFLSLYERYGRLMLKTARAYASKGAVAEDVVQDAIVKLITKIQTLRELSQGTLSAYIVNTVRNTAINHLRRQVVMAKHHTEDGFDEGRDTDARSGSPSPEELVINQEKWGKFIEIFSKLPCKDKDVLLGRYVLGLSDEELSRAYGCKPDSIRMILTRARRNVLAELRKEAFDYGQT